MMTPHDAILAAIVRDEAPSLYMLVDRDDRVLRANKHTRALIGPGVDGARFGDLLVGFERDVSPTRLAREGSGRRLVNVMTFTGLPESWFCWFRAVGDDTLIVGGVDPQEHESLRREMLVLNQSLHARTRELQKANAALGRLVALKDRFLGMAAHDLRAPLQVVIDSAELATEELAPTVSEETRCGLLAIVEAGQQMRGIIDAFLDAAVIESGHLILNRCPSDLGEVARHALRWVDPSARRRGVRVEVEAAPLPELELDGARLEQVIANLLANAIQHSPPGEVVRICVEGGVDGGAVLRVVDRGAGVPADILPDITRAFTSGPGRGGADRRVGLGLAIARLVVEAHGGTLAIENNDPAPGATATFRLPAPPSPADAHPTS